MNNLRKICPERILVWKSVFMMVSVLNRLGLLIKAQINWFFFLLFFFKTISVHTRPISESPVMCREIGKAFAPSADVKCLKGKCPQELGQYVIHKQNCACMSHWFRGHCRGRKVIIGMRDLCSVHNLAAWAVCSLCCKYYTGFRKTPGCLDGIAD